MEKTVTLREFKYFDRQIVEDFLSSIEGGLARETRLSSTRRDSRIGAEAGVPGFKLKGDKSTEDISNEETKTMGDAALFQRLYDALISYKMIENYPNPKEENVLATIKQGSILEIEGILQLQFFDLMLDVFKQVLPVMQRQTLDPKGLAMLGMLSASETLNVRVITAPVTNISLVAVLQSRNLRVPKSELADTYSLLCRVKRVLKEGEDFDILKLPVKLNQKLIGEFLKGFSNMPNETLELLGKKPTEDDLQVHYPALILTPVAIYQ